MFGVFEFVAGLSFNVKIKMIDKKKYTHAAALGSFSTMLFMTLAMTAPLVANGIDAWWFILLGALMMAVGNVLAMLALGPFERFLKRFSKEETKKEGEE